LLSHMRLAPLHHGDVLLFALSSAQVMYAYVMRPETLDKGFWNFIVRAGPIDRLTLGAVRANCGGSPVDLGDLLSGVADGGGGGGGGGGLVGEVGGTAGGIVAAGTAAAAAAAAAVGALGGTGGGGGGLMGGGGGGLLPCVPCAVMHRSTGCPGCMSHIGASAAATFRKCFPFYLSIHLVPFAVLNAAKVRPRFPNPRLSTCAFSPLFPLFPQRRLLSECRHFA
jgi:hypothetical protein